MAQTWKEWFAEKNITNGHLLENAILQVVGLIVIAVGTGVLAYKAGTERPAQAAPAAPAEAEADLRAVLAKRTGQVLSEERGKIDRNLEAIAKAAQALRSADPKNCTDIKTVTNLHAHAEVALAAIHGCAEVLQSLDRELKWGQVSYQVAAQAFRDRSGDVSDEQLKEVYLGWSAHYEAKAAALPRERAALAGLLHELPYAAAMVRQTKIMLGDYATFLLTHHDATLPKEQAAAYQALLAEYAKKFSAMEAAMAGYRKNHP